MTRKTVLSLIEQTIMIGLFAVAAAFCLSAFVYARNLSVENEVKDFAVRECSNTAQVIKSCAGDYDDAADILGVLPALNGITIGYDENFERTDKEPAYVLRAVPVINGYAYLGEAVIDFETADSTVYSLTVSWQEE